MAYKQVKQPRVYINVPELISNVTNEEINDLYRTLYKYEKLEDYDACAGIYKAIKKKINSLNN